MAVPEPCSRPRKPLDAGVFQPEISSFRLHLAAEGKAAKTIRNYVEAVQWFAAAHLLAGTMGRTGKQNSQFGAAWAITPTGLGQRWARPALVI
jgi:hypothetical protein